MPNQTIVVTGISNREFIERYAQPGRIGLSGGETPIDLAIRRAQRHLDRAKAWATWSHAFVFEGVRADGHHWVIESDLQFHKKHIQLGAQENRASKYHDEKYFTALAVLDFGLNAEQVAAVLREGLELVAGHERYSLRELVGTLIAMRRPELRARENVLARERSVFCSALVQRVYRGAGIDLAPGVDDKNTAPEDIARTLVPHTMYVLRREPAPRRLAALRKKLRARIQKIKTRAARK
jgi:hypothetical protein